MQIPKKPRVPHMVQKKCAVEGCNTVFEGSYSSKYCQSHRNPQNRTKTKTTPEEVTEKNQLLEHDFTNVKSMILTCALEGCNEQFEVKVFPKQYVYPKYCPEHRNEQKRKNYLAQLANNNAVHS